MSVTFTVSNSPRRSVTRTYGEEGDGETDTYEETVLPKCNFANGNACALTALLGVDLFTEHGLVGTWNLDEVCRLRECVQDAFADRRVPSHQVARMLALYTMLDSALWFGQPIHYS